MTSFAIYDYTSASRPWPVRLIVPVQRIFLRILRPSLQRLRDLLQLLYDRQTGQAEETAAVVARVSEFEGTFLGAHRQIGEALVESNRQLAETRQQLSEAQASIHHYAHNGQQHQVAEALAVVRQHQTHTEQQLRDALQQLTQAHRALMQDHLALSRRIVMLENLLLQMAAPMSNEDSLAGPAAASFKPAVAFRAEAG